MQRQGEHAVVALKDMGRAIALVHIQVDDRHLQRPARSIVQVIGLCLPGSHRHIVEHTKATALVGI